MKEWGLKRIGIYVVWANLLELERRPVLRTGLTSEIEMRKE